MNYKIIVTLQLSRSKQAKELPDFSPPRNKQKNHILYRTTAVHKTKVPSLKINSQTQDNPSRFILTHIALSH